MAPKWRGARALADPNAPDAITTWIRRHCSGDAVKRKERDCAIRTPEERAAIRDANMERMHAEYQLSKDHALSTVHDEELGHQSPRGDEEEAAEKKKESGSQGKSGNQETKG